MSDRLFILNQHRQQRVVFDPKNKAHLAELKFYIDNKKWKNGCPFYLEHPYVEIPAMVAQRFLEHSLS
jgi:hypothetical protein